MNFSATCAAVARTIVAPQRIGSGSCSTTSSRRKVGPSPSAAGRSIRIPPALTFAVGVSIVPAPLPPFGVGDSGQSAQAHALGGAALGQLDSVDHDERELGLLGLSWRWRFP